MVGGLCKAVGHPMDCETGVRIGAILAFVFAGAGHVQARQDAHAAAATQPGIVFLAVDDITRPWIHLVTESFREVALDASEQPALFFESLDGVRFDDPGYVEAFRDWLRFKYRSTRIDLVVPIGEDAVGFLARRKGEPWPAASILYLEVGRPRVDIDTLLPQAKGLILEDHFPAALAVMKQVLPETGRVALVYGGSSVEQWRFNLFADKVRSAGLGLEPIVVGGESFDDLLTTVAQLPPRTVVFLLAPAVDSTGRVLAPKQTCERMASAASGPLFTQGMQDVGCGVVGGLLRDWSVVGRLLAEHGLARLSGTPPADIHVPIPSYTALVFDARQLDRWQIAEVRLPSGSAIQYRAPSLWRDYRPQVIGMLAVVLFQMLLIGGLVFEHRRRRRAELESRRHLATMAHLYRRAAMGQLTASLAHELNQPLEAILHNAEAAKILLSSGTTQLDEIREIVEDIRKDDRRASDVIRRLRTLLRKRELETEPLDVNHVATETMAVVAPDAASRGVQVDLDLPATPSIVSGDRVHLQQALLNLVLNGMEAMSDVPPDRRRLVVRAARHNGSVDVSVTDSGPGIPHDVAPHIFEPFFTTKGEGMGMGLSIVRSIIEAHDGRIAAETNPQGGATFRFSLPLSGPGPA
jgi:signal transduction histidine kinase